jgi:hypothetical protein
LTGLDGGQKPVLVAFDIAAELDWLTRSSLVLLQLFSSWIDVQSLTKQVWDKKSPGLRETLVALGVPGEEPIFKRRVGRFHQLGTDMVYTPAFSSASYMQIPTRFCHSRSTTSKQSCPSAPGAEDFSMGAPDLGISTLTQLLSEAWTGLLFQSF